MIPENKFHEILKKNKIAEECRKIWWGHWKLYQVKSVGDEESLENFVKEVIKKGCKASCYQ